MANRIKRRDNRQLANYIALRNDHTKLLADHEVLKASLAKVCQNLDEADSKLADMQKRMDIMASSDAAEEQGKKEIEKELQS